MNGRREFGTLERKQKAGRTGFPIYQRIRQLRFPMCVFSRRLIALATAVALITIESAPQMKEGESYRDRS